MLPLSLLNAAQGQPIMVELKSGETLNGHLITCDTWMNLMLKEVIQTSADGEHFMKLPEMYVRGSIIKYLRVPDELLDIIKEEKQLRIQERRQKERMMNKNQRGGGHSGRGGGRGGHRGGGHWAGREKDNPNRNRF